MKLDSIDPEEGTNTGDQDISETPLMRAARDLQDGGASQEEKRRRNEAESVRRT
jgi:hypothetical protein